MKIFLISDNIDTLTGMRLAGIDGKIAHTKEELKDNLTKVVLDKSVGIVLLSENLGNLYPDIVNKFKLEYKLPLFVDIPDRHGTGRKPNFITDYVNEAIGLKL